MKLKNKLIPLVLGSVLSLTPIAMSVSCGYDNKATVVKVREGTNIVDVEVGGPVLTSLKFEKNKFTKTAQVVPAIESIDSRVEFAKAVDSIKDVIGADLNNEMTSGFSINPEIVAQSQYLIPSNSAVSYEESFINKEYTYFINDINAGKKYEVIVKIDKKNPYSMGLNTKSDYFKQDLPNRETLLQNMTSIPVLINFNFEVSIKLDGQLWKVPKFSTVAQASGLNVSSTITPKFSDFEVKPSYTKMKKLSIDWNNKLIDMNSFRAKVISVSDGDTATVVALEDKKMINTSITKGSKYTIRYSGIDTPEKAVSSTLSCPFEYGFALLSSKFGKQILFNDDPNSEFYNVKNEVKIGFTSGSDSYGRLTADIFFGEDFGYSYNAEITREGLTLPYDSFANWKANYNEPKTSPNYVNSIYPEIALAFNHARENKLGFFHYFEQAEQIEKYVYIAKRNSKWQAFEELYKILQKNNEA
ncbi:thermonuclease family protein [Mycoplasma sp. 2704]|uniref:thermonuclease family protein n=1 Tax=Mycoplasma sp. 2704 TaxID=3108529 RepID=UPI002B1DD862|nr:thermonuclease family protein [Mycoplasma sp. 2704]MEA4134365.1 thermonuclease family protein [Mycoplasma sp. 2704]